MGERYGRRPGRDAELVLLLRLRVRRYEVETEGSGGKDILGSIPGASVRTWREVMSRRARDASGHSSEVIRSSGEARERASERRRKDSQYQGPGGRRASANLGAVWALAAAKSVDGTCRGGYRQNDCAQRMRAGQHTPTQETRRETDKGWGRDEGIVVDVVGNDEQGCLGAVRGGSAGAGNLPKAPVGAC